MHDLRAIRENPAAFDEALSARGAEPASAHILALDERRRALTTRMQEAQARRNEASKAIGAAMGKGDSATAEALKTEVAERALFVIDAQGIIRWSYVSPVGVNPGADGVLKALEDLARKEQPA